MTIPHPDLISILMHKSAAGKLARKFAQMGFILLFGAMSIFHYPVMAFGADPHSAHHLTAQHSHHHEGDVGHANPADAPRCDGFACFLAVEPILVTARPLLTILFGVLSFAAADFPLAPVARPDLPPPRLQS
ncbi:MAG: hypothetical protein ABWY35_04995 [Pseudorhodoplanes sp.]